MSQVKVSKFLGIGLWTAAKNTSLDRRFYTNSFKDDLHESEFRFRAHARRPGLVNYGKDIRVGFSRFFCLTYINLPFRCGGVRENKIDEQLALINAKHPLGCYIKDLSRNSIVQLDSDFKRDSDDTTLSLLSRSPQHCDFNDEYASWIVHFNSTNTVIFQSFPSLPGDYP